MAKKNKIQKSEISGGGTMSVMKEDRGRRIDRNPRV